MNQYHYFKSPYNDASEVNKSQLAHQFNVSTDNKVDELYCHIRCPTEVLSFPFRKPHGKTFCASIISKLFILVYSLGILLSVSLQKYPIYKNRHISLALDVLLCISQIFQLQSTETNFSQLIRRSSSLKRHCKTDSQWEAAASHREITSVLCDHLEGWDREGGSETQEGGDMGIYVYLELIHFVIQQKLTQHCKAIILQ